MSGGSFRTNRDVGCISADAINQRHCQRHCNCDVIVFNFAIKRVCLWCKNDVVLVRLCLPFYAHSHKGHALTHARAHTCVHTTMSQI